MRKFCSGFSSPLPTPIEDITLTVPPSPVSPLAALRLLHNTNSNTRQESATERQGEIQGEGRRARTRQRRLCPSEMLPGKDDSEASLFYFISTFARPLPRTCRGQRLWWPGLPVLGYVLCSTVMATVAWIAHVIKIASMTPPFLCKAGLCTRLVYMMPCLSCFIRTTITSSPLGPRLILSFQFSFFWFRISRCTKRRHHDTGNAASRINTAVCCLGQNTAAVYAFFLD